MGKGNIRKLYCSLSPEDQRTFDRWVKANAALGLIFAALVVAMAFAGSKSVGPPEAAVASRPPASPMEAIPVVGFE